MSLFCVSNGDGEKKLPLGFCLKNRYHVIAFSFRDKYLYLIRFCAATNKHGYATAEIWKALLLLKMFVGASFTTTHIINQRLVTRPQRTPIKPYNGYVLRPRNTLTECGVMITADVPQI